MCVPAMRPFVSLDEYGYLELSQPTGDGDSFVDTNMTCSYQPLLNNNVGEVLLGEETKIEFNQLTLIKDSQIVVKCHRNSPSKEIVYEKAFVNVPYASGPAAKPKFKRSDPVASHDNLDNWKKAILHSKRYCHFSIHYMKTLTEDNSDYLTLLDKKMSVGDQLFTSQVEERSPLLSIKLPEKFRRKYHTQDRNIGINVNRLITTSDVGKTLMNIASVKALHNLTLESSAEAARSSSLLQYFHPNNRSCKDANIPAHLCLCMDEEIPQEYTKFVNYS
ncbi:unnamed protein product [Angiostrongylus costaricensis]|uniref:ZP domain-containing protein n=1 Tax=Angiostrongylus costaricensis TaxID=334426 RepID=A0A158PD30_ANGCS|nr:unnamed protein product [Angiostrongylus costaricensis]